MTTLVAIAVALHGFLLGWFWPRVGLCIFALAVFTFFGYGSILCLETQNFAAAIMLALYAVALAWTPLGLMRELGSSRPAEQRKEVSDARP